MCIPVTAAAMAATSAPAMWSSLGTGLLVAGMASGAYGAYNSSKANKAGYEYQAAVNRNNATIANWQAQDAVARGAREEQQQRLRTAALKSTQRATFAARGMALDEGSPLSILQDTEYMGELDASTIKDNAAREAWGYRTQAQGYSSDAGLLDARADAESPMGAAFSSLLTSGGSVASSWYNRKIKTTG